MRAYLAYDDSGIKELGDVSKDDLPALIEQADASLATHKQCGVGLYRSEKDFLEIRPAGKSEYLIWSDRLAPRRLLDLLRVKRHIDRVVIGREAAYQAMLYWMDNSREAFEQKYG
jgi:hypothetical protein